LKTLKENSFKKKLERNNKKDSQTKSKASAEGIMPQENFPCRMEKKKKSRWQGRGCLATARRENVDG